MPPITFVEGQLQFTVGTTAQGDEKGLPQITLYLLKLSSLKEFVKERSFDEHKRYWTVQLQYFLQ